MTDENERKMLKEFEAARQRSYEIHSPELEQFRASLSSMPTSFIIGYLTNAASLVERLELPAGLSHGAVKNVGFAAVIALSDEIDLRIPMRQP